VPRRAKSPAYDKQREEAYDWERQFYSVKCNTAAPKWFRQALKESCARYKIKPPKLCGMPRKWSACAGVCDYQNGKIHFAKGYESILVLCHELAHWILDSYGYGDWGAHGPRWLGVYLWLLDSCLVLPLSLTEYSARKAGLRFRDPVKECAPGKLQRYLKKS
jgi:hypothetical protein